MVLEDEYVTYRNILSTHDHQGKEEGGIDEDMYSSHSNFIRNPLEQAGKHSHGLIKGKINLVLKASLSEEFFQRMEELKRRFIEEASSKLASIKLSLESKQTIIHQAIDTLAHISFDHARGLIVD
jgi:hypothetical protein